MESPQQAWMENDDNQIISEWKMEKKHMKTKRKALEYVFGKE